LAVFFATFLEDLRVVFFPVALRAGFLADLLVDFPAVFRLAFVVFVARFKFDSPS
jgi:hypothetical protein